MEAIRWLGHNWIDLLEIIGLVFAGYQIREEAKARKVSNLISLAQNLHNIWKEQYSRPELRRISDAEADLITNPPSDEERVFVTQLIHHLHTAYQAVKSRMVDSPGDIRRDIALFFSLPIPQAIWKSAKGFQNQDFAQFIDDSIRSAPTDHIAGKRNC